MDGVVGLVKVSEPADEGAATTGAPLSAGQRGVAALEAWDWDPTAQAQAKAQVQAQAQGVAAWDEASLLDNLPGLAPANRPARLGPVALTTRHLRLTLVDFIKDRPLPPPALFPSFSFPSHLHTLDHLSIAFGAALSLGVSRLRTDQTSQAQPDVIYHDSYF